MDARFENKHQVGLQPKQSARVGGKAKQAKSARARSLLAVI